MELIVKGYTENKIGRDRPRLENIRKILNYIERKAIQSGKRDEF